MTHAAHTHPQPTPACPGCGQPMHPTPAGHYTHCGEPPGHDLPRGDTPAVRPRERRIRTTTAVDVWQDYQPQRQREPGDGPAGAKKRGKR